MKSLKSEDKKNIFLDRVDLWTDWMDSTKKHGIIIISCIVLLNS